MCLVYALQERDQSTIEYMRKKLRFRQGEKQIGTHQINIYKSKVGGQHQGQSNRVSPRVNRKCSNKL